MTAVPLTLEDVSRDIMLVQIPKWVKDVTSLLMRRTYLFRALQRKGRVIFEPGGYERIWPLEIRIPDVYPLDNHQGISFEPTSTEIEMRAGYRNFYTSDSMSLIDEWINQGPQALRKMVNQKSKKLRKAMMKEFDSGIYRDGNLTGNERKVLGIPTGLTAGACTSADRIALPNGTYANQSTVLRANGGFWSAEKGTPNNAALTTDWPDGSGDESYDCNAPKLVNTYTLAWGTGSLVHGDNLYRAISQAQTWLLMLGGDDGAPDLAPTDADSFQRLRENQEAKYRLQPPVSGDLDFGLPGSGYVTLDGLKIYPDFWCGHNTTYVLKSDQITYESKCPNKQLFESKGPIEIAQMAFAKIWALIGRGNYFFESMKHFAQIKDFVN